MVKGGYQIINLGGVAHTLNIGMQHENLYGRIEGTQKPILLSGLNIGGFDYHDVYVEPKVVGSSYVIEAYGYSISINDNDVVVINKKGDTTIKKYSLDGDFNDGENTVDSETVIIFRNLINQPNLAMLSFTYQGRLYDEFAIAFDAGDVSLYTKHFSFKVLDGTTIYINNN